MIFYCSLICKGSTHMTTHSYGKRTPEFTKPGVGHAENNNTIFISLKKCVK